MEPKPQFQVMISGVGGQGALLFGQLLCEAALSKYRSVGFFPQYASIMRGGESECTVTLSDGETDSLWTNEPQAAVVMASPKLKALERGVQSGGLLLVDSSVVWGKVEREDIKVFYIHLNC